MSPSAAGGAPMDALLEAMRVQHLAPLWRVYETIVLREPTGVAPSRLWSWNELSDPLTQAMSAVTGDDADHRVLLLTEPALGGRIATTSNLLAGVQCVLPGESTVPHRHTASAVRCVLESAGAVTLVDGKTCVMRPGDVVLTPNWTWHSHGNETNERAVWVDMLDVPLMGLLAATFGARGAPSVYPETIATVSDSAFAQGGLAPVSEAQTTPYSPKVHWRREEVVAALDRAPEHIDGGRLIRFTHPLNGGAVLETLDLYALQLRAGERTRPFRTSASALCVVLEGEGESIIGGATHRWRRNDVFTAPTWSTRSHRALSEVARLLFVTDREMYRRLGLLREERPS